MEVKVGYRQTEVGVIPEDWVVKSLGDLGTFKNGINKGKEDFGYGFPFVNLLDVFGIATISNTAVLGLVNSTAYERKLYELKKGDVLFVRSSVKPLGVGLTTLVCDDLPNTVFSGFLIRFRDNGQLVDEYKKYCFGLFQFRIILIANSTVSANTNINQVALKALQLPFPSDSQEQRTIATALSDVDALITSLDRIIAKKRDIKQAAMQDLLTGKRRLPGFSGGRETFKFGQIASPRKEKLNPKTVNKFPFCIELEDIEQGSGQLQGSSTITHNSSLKTVFHQGDVLFGKLRAYLRKYWLADRDGVCSTEIWPLIPNNRKITNMFLFQSVMSDHFIDAACIAYGTHMPRTDWNVVKNYQISLPPIPEQQAIATFLSDMSAELTALELKRDKTLAIKQGMMQELLTGRIRLT